MNNSNIPEYSISLWNNILSTDNDGTTFLQEIKICDIGNSNYFLPSDAQNPKLTLKDNGEMDFTFELNTNYWDADSATIIENPFIQYLTPERRIKVHFHDEWYDFLLTTVEYNNKKHTAAVTCQGAFAAELGKSGYSLEFSEDLENNLNSAFKLGQAITENSDWRIIDNEGHIVSNSSTPETPTSVPGAKSDLIQEIQKEYLYKVKAKQTFTIRHYFDDQTKTIMSGDTVYLFASCVDNGIIPYALLLEDDIVENNFNEDTNNITIYNKDNWIISTSIIIDDEPDINGYYLPSIIIGAEKKALFDSLNINLYTSIRAQRYISSALLQYDSLVDQYVNLYNLESIPSGAKYPSDWTIGSEIRGYTEIQYLTSDTIRSLINNYSDFLNPYGWSPIRKDHASADNQAQEPYIACINALHPITGETEQIGALGLNFKNKLYRYFNTGFKNSQTYLSDGLVYNDTYVLKVKLYNKQTVSSTPSTLITNPPVRCVLQQYDINSDGTYTLKADPILNFRDRTTPGDPYTAIWTEGYEYLPIYDIQSYTGDIYVYNSDTGVYTKLIGDYDVNKTYYYRSDKYYYTTAKIQHGSWSYDQLFNGDYDFGFFISLDTDDTQLEYFIKDFEVFKYSVKPDGTLFLPQDQKPVAAVTNYKYYKLNSSWTYKEQIEYVITTSPLTNLSQKYSSNCEKRRSIVSSKSNRYNILSELCNTFECWLRFNIGRNEDGSIIQSKKLRYEQITNAEVAKVNSNVTAATNHYYILENGVYSWWDLRSEHYIQLTNNEKTEINNNPLLYGTYYYINPNYPEQQPKYLPFIVTASNPLWEDTTFYNRRYGLDEHIANYAQKYVYLSEKYITFHSTVGQDKYIGFVYGINTSDITRTVKSDEIVTKLLVEENNNEHATYGYCSITDAPSNPSKETYIFNFNHYVNKKLLDGKQLTKDLNTLNSTLRKYNNQIADIGDTYEQACQQVDSLEAQVTTYQALATESANELSKQEIAFFNKTVNYTYDEVMSDAELKAAYLQNSDFTARMEDIARLRVTTKNYQALYANYNKQYITWTNQKESIAKTLSDYILSKQNILYNFELKYNNFIREGTWQSENYDNAETYFLDALNTSENSAYPKVTYSLSVVDLSGIDEYSNYKFNIGDKTFIQDPEIFGYYEDGVTPFKKDVAVTEISYNLMDPSANTITIATFKDEFNDLFQRFAAATQTLEYKEAAYDLAANSVSSSTGYSATLLQTTLDNANITLGSSGKQGVTVDSSGITLQQANNKNNIVRIVGSGVFLSQDGGDTWLSGFTANGFNTSLFTTGTLNVSKLNIMADSTSNAFGWDRHGISAYATTILPGHTKASTNLGKFVRFDQFGLYGFSGSENFEPTSESDILESLNVPFSLTWSGLQIRTNHKEYNIYGELVDGGGIKISQANDFSVYDANGYMRIKIGCLEEAVGGSPARYGMRLADRYGYPMLYANDDGTMWLNKIMYIGGSAYTDAWVEFGPSVEFYSGWVNPTDSDKPLYPIRSDGGDTRRILKIEEQGDKQYLIRAQLDQNITVQQVLEPSLTEVIHGKPEETEEEGEKVYIYILEGCLTNRHSELQFYTLDDSEAAAALVAGELDVTRVSYKLDVMYNGTYGDYGIPYINIEVEGVTTAVPLTKNDFTKEWDGVRTCKGYHYNYGYKFEIYDDGTVRSPKFSISKNGNVYLNYDVSQKLIASTLVSSNDDFIQAAMTSQGLRLYSLEGGVDYTRLQIAITKDGNQGILPYIHFITDHSAEAAGLVSQGLIKNFANGFLWFGNAPMKDSRTFENLPDNKGLLLSLFGGEGSANPVAYIVNGTNYEEIATGNTVAVFG